MRSLEEAEWNRQEPEESDCYSEYKSQFAVGFDVVKTHSGAVYLGLHLGFWTFDWRIKKGGD
jgi:hypothetical protein